MSSIEEQYRGLLGSLLHNSNTKSDRTGTGTLSIFGRQIRHSMSDGFPLLTTKRMAVKTMMTELKWFLRGDTNIKYLVDNNCNIWNGDAYKNYRNKFEPAPYQFTPDTMEEFINKIKTDDEFAKKWGELGPIYGKQWRDWDGRQERDGSYDMSLDQIANLIFQLKRNPDSRRLMVSAWNVGELSEMTLPPCHYGFQCYVSDLSPLEIIDQAKKDGLWKDTIPEGMTLSELQKDFKTKKLSLMWNQRSVDTFLGLPFNIASYGLLLEILAKTVNMVPDELIGNLGDIHLYNNHIDQATEQISREIYDLPQLVINDEFWNPDENAFEQIEYITPDDFDVINYKCHPRIKAPLSN